MQTVDQILRAKSPALLSISSQATVFEALSVMAQHDVGALVVVDAGRLAGMFSERDYARKIALAGKSSRDQLVGDIMTTDVVTVVAASTLPECMALMTNHRIRHLPVMDSKDGVVGVISIGDVVKALLTEQAFVIEQLEHYITT